MVDHFNSGFKGLHWYLMGTQKSKALEKTRLDIETLLRVVSSIAIEPPASFDGDLLNCYLQDYKQLQELYDGAGSVVMTEAVRMTCMMICQFTAQQQ